MKNILILGIFISLIACNPGNKVTQANLELIDNYVTAVENMDFDAMDTYLAEDYIGIGPSYGDTINKTGAIKNWNKNVQDLYQKIEYKRSQILPAKVDEGENKGDWISNWAEMEITYQDNKGKVTLWANTVYKIANGKIVKSYTFYNEADALEQLGYIFINPNDL